jgi:hypothetical protein
MRENRAGRDRSFRGSNGPDSQQQAGGRFPQFFEQLAAHLRNGMDTGERGARFFHTLQPGVEMGRVGQRREQQLFVLALALFVAERDCRYQRRTEKMLAQLAGNQRLAVGA